MKKLKLCLVGILFLGLLVGCGKKQEKELNKNLVSEIEIDDSTAQAVCQVNYDYSDTEGYVVGAKFVIYANKEEIVTRIVGEQITASNNKKILSDFEDAMNEQYSIASQYGDGYQYKIKLKDDKLYVETDLDYTNIDLEEMAKSSEELKAYLTEDKELTLSSVQSMYLSMGAQCEKK